MSHFAKQWLRSITWVILWSNTLNVYEHVPLIAWLTVVKAQSHIQAVSLNVHFSHRIFWLRYYIALPRSWLHRRLHCCILLCGVVCRSCAVFTYVSLIHHDPIRHSDPQLQPIQQRVARTFMSLQAESQSSTVPLPPSSSMASWSQTRHVNDVWQCLLGRLNKHYSFNQLSLPEIRTLVCQPDRQIG